MATPPIHSDNWASALHRQNPKFEYRNPKQFQMTKKENPKQEPADFSHSDFGF
jgi:hypothetical protein